MLKMPEPMCMRSVRRRDVAHEHLVRGDVQYSRRKWCSVNQPYLKPARSAATATATSSSSRSCSSVARLGHVTRVEDPELHLGQPARRRTGARSTRARPNEPPSRPTPDCFVPPNGVSWLRCTVLIPTLPARIRRLDRHRPGRVAAEHVVVEAELGAVGERDALVVVVEGHRHDHRAEDLLLHDLHVAAAAGDQRRLDVPALLQVRGPTAAGDDLAALLAARRDVALDPRPVRLGDDRADHRVLLERVADLEHRGHLGQALDDVVVDRAVHDRPGRRGADLARVERPHRADHPDRVLHVGVVEHERAALAAELEQLALHALRPPTSPMRRADAARSGEAHHVDVGRLDERLARLSGVEPVTMFTTPGGKPTSSSSFTSLMIASGSWPAGRTIDGVAHRERRGRSCRPCSRSGSCTT